MHIRDNMIARPLIPLTAAVIGGILIGETIPGYFWVAAVTGLAALSFFTRLFIRKRQTTGLPWLIFFCLGYIAVQPWVSPRFPGNHIRHFISNEPRGIIGVVQAAKNLPAGRQRIILNVLNIRRDSDKIPAQGRLQVTIRGDESSFQPGDEIRFAGKIRAVHTFRNPGGFDYVRYLAFQKIWARTHVNEPDIIRLSRNRLPGGKRAIHQYRKTIAAAVDRILSGPSNAVMKALIIGDKNGITPALRETFNRTGTGHLLAISGLHVGIVATMTYFVFRFFLSFIPLLLWRAWADKGAALLTMGVILGYGLIAGMSPATQRAVLMGFVFLLAVVVGRHHDPVNTLVLAALVILIVDPPALFSISFQLSFAAVGTILFGLNRKTTSSPSVKTDLAISKTVFHRIGRFMLVSLLAIMGTLPLVMHYFYTVSTIGLPMNLLAVPLIGGFVVPLGLLSAGLCFIWPTAADVGFSVSGFVLAGTLDMIGFAAEFPFAASITISPGFMEIVLYYITLGVAFGTAQKRFPLNWSGYMVLLVSVSWLADAGYWVWRRHFQNDLRVTILDVGQGSAAVLEFPKGRVFMIDGGGFYDNAVFDVGKFIVAPYLLRNKIRTVDTLLLSHPNTDHLNGLLYIAGNFHVKTVQTNGRSADTAAYREFIDAIEKKNISRLSVSDGTPRQTVNNVTFDILHPAGPDDEDKLPKHSADHDHNKDSLAVRVQFGKHAILFPGDIEKKAEQELVRRKGSRLASTVLISPHHGSKTSSSHLFLRKVDPKWIIVSCKQTGPPQAYPHPEVRRRYEILGANVRSTAEHGAVQIRTNGEWIQLKLFY